MVSYTLQRDIRRTLSALPDPKPNMAWVLCSDDFDRLCAELRQQSGLIPEYPTPRLRGIRFLGVLVVCDDEAPRLTE